MATTVKAAAVLWLTAKFGVSRNAVHASKLYVPRMLWWFDIPQHEIESAKAEAIDLLCEVAPGANKFYYLKVPVAYFKMEKSKLDVNQQGLTRMHLSSEPEEMFVDRRGSGRVAFSSFLQTR
jgi:hypothetical protein